MELASRHFESPDLDDAMELCQAKGWTDGLPVVPPTEKRIEAMLDAVGLAASHQVAYFESRQAMVTAEKIAINAVMAGCKPEYMPVVVAAVEALADPLYGYHGPATSTGGAAVLMVVNGPIARELDINSGGNLFGPGWRANATIGRAVRLLMRNTLRTLPGTLDRASLGHAGKYSFCIAENEVNSPWPPMHTERGFTREQNAVTIMAALAPHQYTNLLSRTPEGILATTCANMRISEGTPRRTQYALVFPREHQQIMEKAGWSRGDIRSFCMEHTKVSLAELKRINAVIEDGDIHPGDEENIRSLVAAPEDFLIIAAGGDVGPQAAYIPGWADKTGSQCVTKEIRKKP